MSGVVNARQSPEFEDPGSLYDRALKKYRNEEYDSARSMLEFLLEQNPSDTLTKKSYYVLARSLVEQQKKPVVALKYFYRILKDYPPDNLTDDSLFFIAEILQNQLDQPESAMTYLQAIRDHFPEGDYYGQASQKLARLRDQLNQSPSSHASVDQIPKPRVKLNFENIDIKQLIATFSDLAGKNFVYRPEIEGSVTVISRDGVPVDHLFQLFVSLLETRGYTVVKDGEIYRVEQADRAFQRGIGLEGEQAGLQTRLFSIGPLPEKEVQQILNALLPQRKQLVMLPELGQVLVSSTPQRLDEVERLLTGLRAMNVPSEDKKIFRYVPRFTSADKIKQKLENFLPGFMDKRDFQILADKKSNILVMASQKNSVDFIRRLAQRFDQDIIDRLKMKVFRLEHADEDQVAKQLKQLLAVLPKEYTSQNIKVVPDDRQKAVIVSSVSEQAFEIVERVIQDLDKKRPSAPQNVRVFRLKHADEQKIAKTLNEMTEVLPGEFPTGKLKIIPDQRQRAVIVSAESRQVFDVVQRVIDQLDREDARRPQQYHVYKVRNSKAGPLAEKLNFLYKEQENKLIRVTADEQTNSLVISAPEEEYAGLKDVIQKLDSPKKRILIDAYIVEASSEKVRELGIEWGVEGEITDRDIILGTQFGGGPTVPPGSTPDQGLVAGIFDESGQRLLTALHALEQDDDFKILSTAHLVSNENEEATLSVGDIIPILTQSQTTPEGTLNQSFDFQNVGIDLDIVPKLSSANVVTLDVRQQIQEVEQASLEGVVGAPTRRNRDIETNVSVPEGLTLVLGGVLQKTTSRNFRTVPIVGQIPLLKYLFQSRSKNRERTNLLVFLRPSILGSSQELQDATNRLQNEQNLDRPPSMGRSDTASMPELRNQWKNR